MSLAVSVTALVLAFYLSLFFLFYNAESETYFHQAEESNFSEEDENEENEGYAYRPFTRSYPGGSG
jgi:cbb3-type cytochrome oxidase subunit 3